MDVRRVVRCHQRFAEHACAEVRDDDRHGRVALRDVGDRQRIAKTEIEVRRQPEFLANTH